MNQLSPQQRELVSSLATRLGTIHGIRAVVLGGSHARGRAQPGSDIDLGLLYLGAAPFSIQSVRELAEAVNDTAGPSPRQLAAAKRFGGAGSGPTSAASAEGFDAMHAQLIVFF